MTGSIAASELSDKTIRTATPDNDTLCVSIAETVATAAGTTPEALPPLYDTIDTEALAEVVASLDDDGTVEFSYLGYRIIVSGDGFVDVNER